MPDAKPVVAAPPHPAVSVLLPMRDAAAFLDAAIGSLRAQVFGDFELLLLDDGSRDASLDIQRRHAAADPRLRLLPGPPMGVAATLNRGLAAARGALIARMDGDDIAEPERLARQVAAMEARPELAVLGTGIAIMDAEGRLFGSYVPSLRAEELREGLLLGNRLAHPTVMMRAAALRELGGYRPLFTACEDYDLWLRLSERHPLGNLPDLLLRHRAHPAQSTQRAGAQRLLEEVAARHAARRRRAGAPDPLHGLAAITPEALRAIGVPQAAIRAALAGHTDPALEVRPPGLGWRRALEGLALRLRERDAMGPGRDWAGLVARARTPAQRERIFVMMPAYRDTEAQWTIRDCFAQAADPDRVSVGVVWQVDPQDDAACFLAATRPDQVRALCFDYREARGCSWARNQGMRLWEGEGWLLQVDSHMRFAPGWDRRLLAQHALCPSPRALLTARPPHYDLPDARHPEMFSVMTADHFDARGVLVFGALPGEPPPRPAPTAFCGGGFLFGPAERAVEVPFDPHIYFLGEEPNLATRLWTHGWDLFCPTETVLWHHYGPSGPGRRHSWGEVRRSQRLHEITLARMDHLLGVRRTRSLSALTDLWRYGLGRARSIAQYQAYAGVDFRARRIEARARRGEVAPGAG
jgi:glycosyltransferase involved in cell wall biosynthesis